MRVAVKSDLLKRDGLKAGHLFEHRRIVRYAEVQLYRVSETHVFRRQRSVVLHGHYGEVFGSAAQLGFLVGADDALTAITLTGSSSNQAVIPDSAITFGAVGTTGRTVTAAAASTVSGPVTITITATDPGGTSATMTWNVTVNAVPVLTMSTKTTPENVPIDIDLRTFASDDLTPLNGIHLELSLAKKGSVVLLPDGHTARFTPNANFNGAATFKITACDQSLGTRVLFLYDFEAPDVSSDAKSTDKSNFNRTGTLELAVGGEYGYAAEAAAALAPWLPQSLYFNQNPAGGGRIRRVLTATELDYNDADWTFSAWVRRASTATDDIIFHPGAGDGFGTDKELPLYFAAGSDVLRLQKFGASGLEAEIVGRVPHGNGRPQ